jgi:hypothetical protein
MTQRPIMFSPEIGARMAQNGLKPRRRKIIAAGMIVRMAPTIRMISSCVFVKYGTVKAPDFAPAQNSRVHELFMADGKMIG